MNQALQYCSLVLDILCVTYFVTSVTIPDPQTSDMRHIHRPINLFIGFRSYTVNNVSTSSGISSP